MDGKIEKSGGKELCLVEEKKDTTGLKESEVVESQSLKVERWENSVHLKKLIWQSRIFNKKFIK
jgi:hypothetical protein